MAAFWATASLTWLWAVPGSPLGLSVEDYSPNVISALLLAGAGIGTGAAGLILRASARRTDAALKRLAFYDPLTGVANRALFMDRLEQAAIRTRHGELIALLYLDLDDFKSINDRFGHAAGDQALVTLTDRIGRCLRPGDTVGRLGGDEFAVILENVPDWSFGLTIAERIVHEVSLPFSNEDRTIEMSASVGVALGGGVSERGAEELLRSSDNALYRAKAQGKGQVAVASEPSLLPPAKPGDEQAYLRGA